MKVRVTLKALVFTMAMAVALGAGAMTADAKTDGKHRGTAWTDVVVPEVPDFGVSWEETAPTSLAEETAPPAPAEETPPPAPAEEAPPPAPAEETPPSEATGVSWEETPPSEDTGVSWEESLPEDPPAAG